MEPVGREVWRLHVAPGEGILSARILHPSAPQSWDQQECEGNAPGPQHPHILPLQEGQSLAEGNVSTANAKASSNETAKSLISAIKACSFLPLAVPVESLPQRSDLCKSSFSA